MNELRRGMIEGRPNPICSRCYEQEASGFVSLRNAANRDFAAQFSFASETAKDGSVPHTNIIYLDIRFSNVCNYRCRTCGPFASTAWYRDAVDKPDALRVIRPMDSSASLMSELTTLLPNVEQIYFAGGEPGLMREHYVLLGRLIEIGRTDVRLAYPTNFSTFRFMDWDLFDLWSHFPSVTVGASLDGSGTRGDYLRKGQVWKNVIENRKLQMLKCPHVSFRITSTLSNLNCLHLPDFHQEWVDQGLVDYGSTQIKVLQDPMHFRLTTLPLHIKDRVSARYERHIRSLTQQPVLHQSTIDSWESAIRYMNSVDTTASLAEFRYHVTSIDKRRGESFQQTFPELADLLP